MNAVRLAVRAQARARWRSWLIVAVLIAFIGGIVLGLAAAGRRTASAFPHFVAATNSADALVYSASEFGFPSASIAHLPQVSEAGVVAFPQALLSLNGRMLDSDWQLVAPATAHFGATIERGRLIEGRWASPNSLDEAVVSYTRSDGVHIGSILKMSFYTPDQAGDLFDSFGPIPRPDGMQAKVRVVGVAAYASDFPNGGSPSISVYITKTALAHFAKSSAVAYADAVRLHGGTGALSSFETALARLHGGSGLYVDALGGGYANVERSIHYQAVSWWILAGIAAAAGLVVIVQLLVRQAALEASEFGTLRSLGMGERDLFLLGLLSMTTIALAGALGAVALAFALSPLTPIGEAAVAETHPGFSFDMPALLLGAFALFVLVAGLGAIPALFEARRQRAVGHDDARTVPQRPSVLAGWLAQTGAAISVVLGTRLAFERGRGRAAVPSFAAFCGASLAVLALVGTAVFGASLGRLLDSPRLYGGTFDLQIDNPGGTITTIVPALLAYKDISQLSTGVESAVRIGTTSIDTIAEVSEKGPLLTPPVVNGHAVAGPDQIVLGESSLHQIRGQIGELVPVTIGNRTMTFKIVGTAAFPVFGNNGGLGNGADMMLGSYDTLAGCAPGATSTNCVVDGATLNLKPGPARASTLVHLEAAFGNGAAPPVVPSSLVNFGQSSDLPLVLGLTVAVFGAATLLHLLVVSVTRRRRETGVLKTLGLIGSQVRHIVHWQASSVMLVALVLGVPLGLVAGRFAWDLTATDLGVVSEVVIPIWSLAAVVAGSLVGVNLVALAPAALSARLRPAALLRVP